MRILLTGATGYIGKRLMHVLAEAGHEVIACVRSKRRLSVPEHLVDRISAFEADLLKLETLQKLPRDIDAAYYLVHSMGFQAKNFSPLEATCAQNFVTGFDQSNIKQVIYLSGLSHAENKSEHMSSRHKVEEILKKGTTPVTILRASIIVGSGSISFEIIRDLVEKLPIMIAPRWVFSKTQPIAITDVLFYLQNVMGKKECMGQTFEIGGPEVMTYRSMLIRFGKLRGLRRWIIPVPFLTPYLSSLWLFLVTSANLTIAKALIDSLKSDAVCRDTRIHDVLPHPCLSYKESIEQAFEKIEQNAIISSWRDAMIQSTLNPKLAQYIEVPKHGCLHETCQGTYASSKQKVLQRIWSLGGDRGWYFMNWAWEIRGWVDRMMGGIGSRRGRTHPTKLKTGDVLDFWRVVKADREEGDLLLYAEMLIPGEAWLEWKVTGNDNETTIVQTATFRPKGLLGRLYWYALFPVHKILFRRLLKQLGTGEKIRQKRFRL